MEDANQDKVHELMRFRSDVANKIKEVKEFHESMLKQVNKATKSSLIGQAEEMINKIKAIETEEVFKKELLEGSMEFETGLMPPLDFLQFTIKEFSAKGEEPVYSEFLVSNGLKWRLKVYTKGVSDAKDKFLSVFLEIVEVEF